MLSDAWLNIVENRNQGSMPAKTMMGYGAPPSLGSLASRPNITVNTTIVRNGRTTAQATPMTVCL
jgi:hypothetical protein